jgi:hypothetical protein
MSEMEAPHITQMEGVHYLYSSYLILQESREMSIGSIHYLYSLNMILLILAGVYLFSANAYKLH